MAGLCEGDNEPAGSLKAISKDDGNVIYGGDNYGVGWLVKALACRSEVDYLVGFFRGFPQPGGGGGGGGDDDDDDKLETT
ncbi:hypothetical protein ANN_17040 [Periplaneta americana]|uniref:Uncharacterized protein n=1 Tax=Periplaneta americana TaxID=6978 RepID=A0ABQ8SSL6_PERAM|nr:hypothetical protein ANN_17040 [Periplaneta americana]